MHGIGGLDAVAIGGGNEHLSRARIVEVAQKARIRFSDGSMSVEEPQ